MQPLYILDFSNYVYRFKSVHTYAKVNVNNVEVDTSVLVGFVRSLKANVFSDICIVLDGFPEEHYKLLPTYKGTRNHSDSENLQVPKIETIKFLTKIGEKLGKNIFVAVAPCQEADQVASSITHIITGNLPKRSSFIDKLHQKPLSVDRFLLYLQYAQVDAVDFSKYDSVILGSTDADWLQLLRYQNVFVDKSTTGKEVTGYKSAESVSNCTPIAIPLYKTLFGDEGDNIPPISLKLNKSALLPLINKWCVSMEQLMQFKECVLRSDNPQWLQIISKELLDNPKALSEFNRNWELTYLSYYSNPLKLDFPDYNIQDTAVKYRIRF